jgi:hypothetical protein
LTVTEALLDLLGDPIPANRGKRGRPAHVVTAQNRQKVELLLGVGEHEDTIAECLRITLPTLRKHYFFELEVKRVARVRLKAKTLEAISAQIGQGNVSAMALMDKIIERERFGPITREAKQPKPVKLGKKELALIEARMAGHGTTLGRLIN